MNTFRFTIVFSHGSSLLPVGANIILFFVFVFYQLYKICEVYLCRYVAHFWSFYVMLMP
jgi:hypothetical protein